MNLSIRLISIATLNIFLAFFPWTSYGRPFHMYVLNIGQGDSILLQTPENHKVLIDAGPDQSVISQLDQVLPFWDRHIDAIIPTHPQLDHVAGFLSVLDHFHVDRVLETAAKSQSELSSSLDQKYMENNVKMQNFYQGDVFKFDDGVRINSIWPKQDTNWQAVADLNDVAQVDLVKFKFFSALLTSDAGANIDNQLSQLITQDITVLKVPHHGSKTGMDNAFLAKIAPQDSIISVGVNNRYGHPTNKALDQLRQVGSQIFRTDIDGRVEVGVDGSGFWIKKSGLTYNGSYVRN